MAFQRKDESTSFLHISPFPVGCYNRLVRRVVLAIIVGMLTFSASGVSSLVINEPCTGYELPERDDGACPPTCVTCGCCAQAAEPVTVVVAMSPDILIADIATFLPDVPRTTQRDILHVPKFRLL